MGENVGAQGAIYRGRAGHRRGARGKQRSPSMAAFNSHVTGAEENGSAPFTRGEREGRLRGAHFYAEEAARGTPCGGAGSVQRRRQQMWILDFTLSSIASVERKGAKAKADY
jgi:hypothetical protein